MLYLVPCKGPEPIEGLDQLPVAFPELPLTVMLPWKLDPVEVVPEKLPKASTTPLAGWGP